MYSRNALLDAHFARFDDWVMSSCPVRLREPCLRARIRRLDSNKHDPPQSSPSNPLQTLPSSFPFHFLLKPSEIPKSSKFPSIPSSNKNSTFNPKRYRQRKHQAPDKSETRRGALRLFLWESWISRRCAQWVCSAIKFRNAR